MIDSALGDATHDQRIRKNDQLLSPIRPVKLNCRTMSVSRDTSKQRLSTNCT